jgi:hypothetical protein
MGRQAAALRILRKSPGKNTIPAVSPGRKAYRGLLPVMAHTIGAGANQAGMEKACREHEASIREPFITAAGREKGEFNERFPFSAMRRIFQWTVTGWHP